MRILVSLQGHPRLRGAAAADWAGCRREAAPSARYVRRVLNCFDESALELALRLSDARAGPACDEPRGVLRRRPRDRAVPQDAAGARLRGPPAWRRCAPGRARRARGRGGGPGGPRRGRPLRAPRPRRVRRGRAGARAAPARRARRGRPRDEPRGVHRRRPRGRPVPGHPAGAGVRVRAGGPRRGRRRSPAAASTSPRPRPPRWSPPARSGWAATSCCWARAAAPATAAWCRSSPPRRSAARA